MEPGRLTIGVVAGVTPDRWLRAWRERMPTVPIEVRVLPDAEAGAALQGEVDMVLARLPLVGVEAADVHVIPLWEETPMVVAAKDHPIRVFDAVTIAELADEQVHPGWDEATLDVIAAGHGVVRMPQAVYRATGRRDLVARPVSDAEPTRIGLAWLKADAGPLVDEFVGIVRGRTANSSRGAVAPPTAPEPAPSRPARQPARRQPRRPDRRGRDGRAPGRRR